MYWFSYINQELNDLYDLWLFSKNREIWASWQLLDKDSGPWDPTAKVWHGMVRIIQ
jgi:hypothetical protein